MTKIKFFFMLFIVISCVSFASINAFYNQVIDRAEKSFVENVFVEELHSVSTSKIWAKGVVLTKDQITLNSPVDETRSYRYFAAIVLFSEESASPLIKNLYLKAYDENSGEMIDKDLYFTVLTSDTTLGFYQIYGSNTFSINSDSNKLILLLFAKDNLSLSDKYYLNLETRTSSANWLVNLHDKKYLDYLTSIGENDGNKQSE